VKRYLLDTNVVSELRKSRPHGAVVAWMEGLTVEQVFISAVTMGELQAGVELIRKQDVAKAREIDIWLTALEKSFAFVAMDASCFREWSRLMAGKQETLRDDAMIAATARVHNLTVSTRNEKDFWQFGVDIYNPFTFRKP
jgi:toxin FitB